MKTMALALSLLAVIPVLGLLGCVSDFSPDPLKEPDELGVADAGTAVASRDAGSAPKRDAPTSTPSDAGSTTLRNDPPNTTPDGKKDAGATPPGAASPPDEGKPAAAACNLTGRWIMTERAMSSAFGAKQINILWHYVELAQQGNDLTVKKSMLCGGKTVGEPGGFAVMMDDSQAWPSYVEKTNYNGRKGTSTDSGGRCDVAFEEAVLVRGMTAEYKDTKVALPTLEEKANGGKGWEDWDADGQPGVTMNVSGAATGKVFTAFRTSGNCSGSIAANTTAFSLDNYDWVTERAVLGTDPSDPITRSLLASPAERAPDKGKNFVEFARLAADQATGDDSATCEAIRSLAPTLNAIANKI